jgi:hypothetical protein
MHMLGSGALERARARLGSEGVRKAEERGEAVPAAARVTRACQLARAAADQPVMST